jgi:cell shape-determining protein MreC
MFYLISAAARYLLLYWVLTSTHIESYVNSKLGPFQGQALQVEQSIKNVAEKVKDNIVNII